ncbi:MULTISPECIES: 3-hydroxyacyl-CoA dehydrogenase family protein [Chitinophagaceae]
MENDNNKPFAVKRTLEYGVRNAKQPKRLKGKQDFAFKKISVLGAGMMGAGIAFEIAKAGIPVYLKDTNIELAEKGKAYTEKCCNKRIQLGKMDENKKTEMLSLIHPTVQLEDLKDSDFIIEAVFEDKKLKENVISETTHSLTNDGVFASNTTSLPISELAAYTSDAANFIGMHFFSPVDRMKLVEIILGKNTSNETLDKALQLALKLQKVPIVVHDSPAFFTSRIFFNYLLEAVTMLLEGIPAARIEENAINAGFAVSPLAVLDEISIPLMLHVYDQLPQLSSSQKRCYNYLAILVEAGRTGRKSGKGFYDYDSATKTKQLWLDPTIHPSTHPIDNQTIQKRLLHVMALDSYRCLDEGVLDQAIDGDIGSIMGVGYAANTGGVFAHIDEVGIQQFVKECQSFSSLGEQWQVPDSLKKLAEESFSFYNGLEENWKKK